MSFCHFFEFYIENVMVAIFHFIWNVFEEVKLCWVRFCKFMAYFSFVTIIECRTEFLWKMNQELSSEMMVQARNCQKRDLKCLFALQTRAIIHMYYNKWRIENERKSNQIYVLVYCIGIGLKMKRSNFRRHMIHWKRNVALKERFVSNSPERKQTKYQSSECITLGR